MKYIIVLAALLIQASCGSATPSDQDRLSHYIRANAYLVIDAETGKIVAQKNPFSAAPVASTTKMVTALAARDLVEGDPLVTVTKEAASVSGAKAGLRAGDQYRFSDLLTAMLVRSANDAATAIAIHASGSRTAFVKAMNAWCRGHSLQHSSFADPAGLSSKSISSPDELVRITREFLSIPEFEAAASLNEFALTSAAGRKIPLKSLNTLRKVMPEDVLSLKGKTGFTSAAKYCFAGRAMTPNGKWFIAVTGAQSSWREVYMLVKYCDGELDLK